MPTASQAMIVMNGEGEDPRIPRRRYNGETGAFSVANYDMELALRLKNIGFLNQGISGTGFSDQIPGKFTKMKGLSTNMGTYDPVRKVYRWEVSNAHTERRPQMRSSDTNTTENIVWFPKRENMDKRQDFAGNKLPKLGGKSGSTPNVTLEDLGFRKRKTVPKTPAHPKIGTSLASLGTKFVLSPNERHTVTIESVYEKPEQETRVGDSSLENPVTETTPKSQKLSLLEDVKRTVKYDSRVQPAMYMRKNRPPPNPFAVCFSFRENDDYTHIDVRDILETQLGLKVRSVQYDPLSIRSSDPDVGTRWIVTYATPAECEFVASKGVEVNGDKIAIKLLDDVINCECEAYALWREDERQKRIAEGNRMIRKERKRKRRPKD
ncbi:uncharacterized protein LOC134247366 [Saccostrea cucullata]|uniref:uncharacterized protein LOC134247366 n=1 Tax=Saccostrea cuccullata TaxID=36930 RepID=UPI002ED2C587